MDGKLTVAHNGQGDKKSKSDAAKKISISLYETLKNLPKPERDMKLSRAQKKWWVWFGVEFIKSNQVAKLDLIHLQKAAFWMDARCQAFKKINELGYDGGVVQTFQNKTSNISGHVTAVEKADKHLDQVSAHFGLSMRDRARIKVTEEVPENQLNLFDEIKNLLHA